MLTSPQSAVVQGVSLRLRKLLSLLADQRTWLPRRDLEATLWCAFVGAACSLETKAQGFKSFFPHAIALFAQELASSSSLSPPKEEIISNMHCRLWCENYLSIPYSALYAEAQAQVLASLDPDLDPTSLTGCYHLQNPCYGTDDWVLEAERRRERGLACVREKSFMCNLINHYTNNYFLHTWNRWGGVRDAARPGSVVGGFFRSNVPLLMRTPK